MLKEHLTTHGFLWGPEHTPYSVSGFMNYGPMGKKLKSNMERGFRSVFQKEGFEEIETPVLYPQTAWQASGHLPKFEDEMFHTQTSNGIKLVGRSELATTIYPLFRKLLAYYGGKLPFKIYQTGIVLPNDRQTEWQIRTRQYTAHEGHIFFETGQVNVDETIEFLQNLSFELMASAGIARERVYFREKQEDDKPFYAKKAYGLYTATHNNKELELLGIQFRSSYDFEKHSKATGLPLKTNGKYPEVFEISFSTDRPFLILLEQALKNIDGRIVLQLPDHLAPIPSMIFPLDNNDELIQRATNLSELLGKAGLEAPVLTQGSIGQRYKRADALGTPFVFTIDNREDTPITLRQRDTRVQAKIHIGDIMASLQHTEGTVPTTSLPRKIFEIAITKGKV